MRNKVISRSSFINMTLMMAALLFLFQFTEMIKNNWNEYGVNEYLPEEPGAEKSQIWQQPDAETLTAEKSYVVLIGRENDGEIADMTRQWCAYTKRPLLIYADLDSCLKAGMTQPELLLLDPACLDYDKDVNTLTELNKAGAALVFCDLPESQVLSENRELRELLGIWYVKQNFMPFNGIHLYSGFLLGGEAIYSTASINDEEKQDLNLRAPWYVLASGTKVYMAGMPGGKSGEPDPEQKKYREEAPPPLIWRNSTGGVPVFAVNGSYMRDNTGIGILSAMTAELYSYEIYPVVNAQNLTVVDYPGLASENAAEMQRLYSRGQREVLRDIIWPGLDMVLEKSGNKLTGMVEVQSDYADENLPEEEDYIYYLKLLKESGAEAGLSLRHGAEISLEEKLAQDELFLRASESSYAYGSLYVSREELGQVSDLQGETMKTIRTVTGEYAADQPLFTYLNDRILMQSATADGFRHTFGDDLRLRSLETALGYSNIMMNVNCILWPQTEGDRWELLYDEFARNTVTYWKPFRFFEKTTLLESDARVRNFLTLDYTHQREGQQITLQISSGEQQTWFLLRTHGEEVGEVEGGSFQRLEKDVYLIEALQEHVEIQMKERTIPIGL